VNNYTLVFVSGTAGDRQRTLAKSYCQVADGHAEEADVKQIWSSSRLSVIIMRSD
jgi:hypothetical protein